MKNWMMLGLVGLALTTTACRRSTRADAADKVENTAEDAADKTEDTAEEAGDKVEDATE